MNTMTRAMHAAGIRHPQTIAERVWRSLHEAPCTVDALRGRLHNLNPNTVTTTVHTLVREGLVNYSWELGADNQQRRICRAVGDDYIPPQRGPKVTPPTSGTVPVMQAVSIPGDATFMAKIAALEAELAAVRAGSLPVDFDPQTVVDNLTYKQMVAVRNHINKLIGV